MSNTGRIQAIDRAILVLKCFNEDRSELKLSEISDMLDINKSTLHGIIGTLKFHGLIDQNIENKKYRLGLDLVQLGESALKSIDIVGITSPFIEELNNILQETVHIGTLDGLEVVYLNKKESKQSMRIFTTIGARNPAHCTGVGKSMLAYLDEDVLNDIIPSKLKRLSPFTITDKNELLNDLRIIKKNGYALDNEEFSLGLKCVAAPIFDHNNNIRYGISVSGPTVRMTDEKIQESIVLMKKAAKEISAKIGYKK